MPSRLRVPTYLLHPFSQQKLCHASKLWSIRLILASVQGIDESIFGQKRFSEWTAPKLVRKTNRDTGSVQLLMYRKNRHWAGTIPNRCIRQTDPHEFLVSDCSSHGQDVFKTQCYCHDPQQDGGHHPCGPMGPNKIVDDLMDIQRSLHSFFRLGIHVCPSPERTVPPAHRCVLAFQMIGMNSESGRF